MADVKNQFAEISFKKPLIFYENLPVYEIEKKLEGTPEIYAVGFDILQIPRFVMGLKQD